MTNQETIANLNMISVAFVEPVTKEQRKLIDDTFDNAIKALEKEPCEDAISRQAVIDAIEDDNRNGMWSCFVSDDDAQKFKTVIKELPSVKQEPKTGHWIAIVDKWGDVVTTINGYKCSECGEFNAYKDKYCPNCGAKMVEPQERSEE